jgi:hypothetical protein
LLKLNSPAVSACLFKRASSGSRKSSPVMLSTNTSKAPGIVVTRTVFEKRGPVMRP